MAPSCLHPVSPTPSRNPQGTGLLGETENQQFWRNCVIALASPPPYCPCKSPAWGQHTGVSTPLTVTNSPGNSRRMWHSDIQCLNKQQKLEILPRGMESVGDTSPTTFDWLSHSMKISLLLWKKVSLALPPLPSPYFPLKYFIWWVRQSLRHWNYEMLMDTSETMDPCSQPPHSELILLKLTVDYRSLNINTHTHMHQL